MSKVHVTGSIGDWTVTIGEGVSEATYKDLTPNRGRQKAEERAAAVAAQRRAPSGSAYTSNVFLFGAQGVARARTLGVGGLFGEDIEDAERALARAGRDE